jgi:hypothetical protein
MLLCIFLWYSLTVALRLLNFVKLINFPDWGYKNFFSFFKRMCWNSVPSRKWLRVVFWNQLSFLGVHHLNTTTPHQHFGVKVIHKSKVKVITTDGQSARLSWYQATIWEPQRIFLSLRRILLSDICGFSSMGALSDERVCLQSTRTSAIGLCQRYHSGIQVQQNSRSYVTVSFETVFPFCRYWRLVGLWWRYSNPPPRICLRIPHRNLLKYGTRGAFQLFICSQIHSPSTQLNVWVMPTAR